MILRKSCLELLRKEALIRERVWRIPDQSWGNRPELLSAISSFATDSRSRVGKRRLKQTLLGDGPPAEGSPRTADDKEMLLQAALANISAKFGKDTVMRLGQEPGPRLVPVVSTGSLSLDIALGVGGLPKGRVVEIYGPEATGKTTLALHVIAEAQKQGGKCVFLDVEHALDTTFAEALGVRLADLYVSQPDNAEQALEITDEFIRSGGADVVVLDSVAALAPKAELEGSMGDAHMALQARLMSQALRKLTHSLGRSQTILIFINQTRSKLGSFGGFGGAPMEVTAGGNALKFYASVRLKIKKLSLQKRGDETTGSLVLVTVAKNKVAPPFKTAEFEIEFGKGISQEGEILDFGVKLGLLGKSGGWFSHDGDNFANGRENAKKYLKENKEFARSLVEVIKGKFVLRTESSLEHFSDQDELDDDFHVLDDDHSGVGTDT